MELVTRNYWWPGVTKKVKRYMEGYDQCQRMKNKAEMPAGKLRPNEIPERPWQHISVDFITKLLMSKGHDLILVVCDRFSKMSHFVVITEKTTVEGLVRLFRDNVWKLHRLPESVISDREPQFAAGSTKELNKMLGIETKLSTAYHPQTDSVKIIDSGLHFLFSLHFSFSFYFILFYFLFLEQLGLGFISHAVTSSHKLMAKLQD